MLDNQAISDRARSIAAERGISVNQARKMVQTETRDANDSDRQARGVRYYEFRHLASRRVETGEYESDRAAEDACASLVAADDINRQIVRRVDGGAFTLVRVVTR